MVSHAKLEQLQARCRGQGKEDLYDLIGEHPDHQKLRELLNTKLNRWRNLGRHTQAEIMELALELLKTPEDQAAYDRFLAPESQTPPIDPKPGRRKRFVTFCPKCGSEMQLGASCQVCAARRESTGESTVPSEKNAIVAIVLCSAAYFGVSGLHRFYVGKIRTGILMLVTLGGFGVWSLIDLVLIVVGRFRDKDGLPVKWTKSFPRTAVVIAAALSLFVISMRLDSLGSAVDGLLSDRSADSDEQQQQQQPSNAVSSQPRPTSSSSLAETDSTLIPPAENRTSASSTVDSGVLDVGADLGAEPRQTGRPLLIGGPDASNAGRAGTPPPASAEPATEAQTARAPVRVGGSVTAPTKVYHAPPVYPTVARRTRTEGVVILEAVIGTTGEVEDVKVLRSVPLLDEAAVTAVRQWRYTATLLNGVPVPVVMTVTVNFTLE